MLRRNSFINLQWLIGGLIGNRSSPSIFKSRPFPARIDPVHKGKCDWDVFILSHAYPSPRCASARIASAFGAAGASAGEGTKGWTGSIPRTMGAGAPAGVVGSISSFRGCLTGPDTHPSVRLHFMPMSYVLWLRQKPMCFCKGHDELAWIASRDFSISGVRD